MPRRIPEGERVDHFWSKVNKDGPVVRPDLGPCWEWTDHLTDRGYGQYFVYRKPVYAHVYAYTLTYGPPRQKVQHRCDYKPCVRPYHLRDGSQLMNVLDAQLKGRMPISGRVVGLGRRKGERHRNARLTERIVRDLRRQYPDGFPRGVRHRIAAELGVRPQCLTDAVTVRRTWRHL